MSVVGIVLAGGAGSRLYPLSTPEAPKQFIPLVGRLCGCSMALRLILRSGCDELGIITSGKALEACQRALEMEPANVVMRTTVLVESHPAGTYFSYVMAAHKILADSVLIVTPSDHWIANPDAMVDALRRAVRLAYNFEGVVILGEVAITADPAVGYLRVAMPRDDHASGKLSAFIQRPGIEKAARLMDSGDHVLWNTGVTVARASVWRRLMSPLPPQFSAALRDSFHSGAFVHIDTKALSQQVAPVGIDEAIIARPGAPVLVQRVRSGWHDIGTPEGLARARAAAGVKYGI